MSYKQLKEASRELENISDSLFIEVMEEDSKVLSPHTFFEKYKDDNLWNKALVWLVKLLQVAASFPFFGKTTKAIIAILLAVFQGLQSQKQ